MLFTRSLLVAAAAVLALSSTACSLLTQPDPIKIAAEPLPAARPAPAPMPAPAGNPAPAPQPPSSGG